jgi:protein-S-isoprenylcysteine O-methyltransferase Ste14
VLAGIAWLVKHTTFRDKNFDVQMKPHELVALFLFVDLYWIAPWSLTKYRRDAVVGNVELVAVMALWGFGCGLHYMSDLQKYMTLKLRGRGLITEGFFSLVRNPNYLGEVMIYTAFAILARSYVASAVLIYFIVAIFVPNMRKKDKSLEKYATFADYKARTNLIVPFLW